VLLAIIVGVALLWTPLHPAPPTVTSRPGGGGNNAPIEVTFGTPTTSNVTCGNGANVTLETVPWDHATATVRTGDIVLEVRELFDGDVVGGPTVTPDVTTTNDCAGAPPGSGHSWYAVLANPAGTNLASFSYSQAWTPINGAPPSVIVTNGATVTILIVPAVANLGYGLFVYGGENGPNVEGSVTL
jgi:hypothetical protein